jgi:hypothetical protein
MKIVLQNTANLSNTYNQIQTIKHDDGHDDAEDAITEMLRYIWTKWHLFMNQNQ